MNNNAPLPIPRLATGIASGCLDRLGSNGGFSISPETVELAFPEASLPIVEAMHTPFSLEDFAVPRTPLIVGHAALQGFHREIAISDMPIKWPGLGYRVPSELAALKGVLQQCANAEALVNPSVDEYYAYLTVQHAPVRSGEIKRGEGAHSDSIQGRRIQPKVAIEHGYTATSHDPTRFFTHGFDLSGLDPDRHWLNAAFAAQTDTNRSIRLRPGDIALFDAYSIHEAVPASETTMRTFFRLIFSVREFDRLGNTVNDLFDYSWNFQPRPVPSDLIGLPPST